MDADAETALAVDCTHLDLSLRARHTPGAARHPPKPVLGGT